MNANKKIDNLGIGTSTIHIDKRREDSSIGISIININKEAENLGIEIKKATNSNSM